MTKPTLALNVFTQVTWLMAALTALPGLAAPTTLKKQPIPPPQVLPTRYDQDRFFATPITSGGQRLTLFTDTGGGLFIAQAAVKRLGLTVRTVSMDGQDVQAAALPPLSLRASIPAVATNNGVLPVAPPDNGPGAFIYRDVDGLLGQAWFKGRVWTFDYPGRRLLLRAPGDLPRHSPEHVVPIGFQANAAGVRQANYPRIQAAIVGEKLDLLLDTGATTNLTPAALSTVADSRPAICATSFIVASVFDRWHAQHPEWRLAEHAESGSGQAMIEVPRVTVAGYTVGPVWFTRRRDAAFHDFMSQFMDKQIDGSLGGDALRHFRVTLDYPRAVAVFEEPAISAVTLQQRSALPMRNVILHSRSLGLNQSMRRIHAVSTAPITLHQP